MKKEITKQEYLQLEGLMLLARTHNDKMTEYWEAINHLMEDENNEISEYVFDKHSVKDILKWRKIKVTK